MTDLVILNGKVLTFDGPDAEALAIKGGLIAAVGTNAEIRAMAGAARVFDAQGSTVLPGFIDSHVHLFQGAAELEYLDLTGVFGLDALTRAVRAYAAERPDDVLLYAYAASYHAMGDRSLTRHDLDDVLPDRPFACMAPDCHTAWANTRALELAGLLQGKAVEEGSEVVMGADGTATGELREAGALAPVMKFTPLGGRDMEGSMTGADPIPAPTPAQRAIDKAVLEKGLRHCASRGITGLHNMDGNLYQLELLAELEAEDKLLCRTEVPLHLKHTDPLERLEEAAYMRQTYASSHLWSSRVKMFIDGVIENRTAFMLQPYPGTENRGAPLFSDAHFKEVCTRADAMELQISVHACGDAGVRRTLDAYEAARRANGPRDSRHRVEHIETVSAGDIPRFRELGVIASMQPLHAPHSSPEAIPELASLLHNHQIPTAFPSRTLRKSGAKVIFSTDWPVVPVDVMATIQGAVARQTLPGGWQDQTHSLRQALAAYTCDGAWAEFNEHRKGRLRAGMMADVVVMDCDLEAQPADSLSTAQAVLTICGGHVTFEARCELLF
ncbi:amidohydrolase [Leisingera sp. ANG-M6]|uniref:amidohydrolase n=1 Tax=Leisingera sp. ANG-M6 TaxID=1577900 RepID=UPI00057E7F24|nr:amidohydrolase [Leisingera sp. ANG-M6]KIC28330.1 amidohydrolase [Leisingera sp. ANG-M6]